MNSLEISKPSVLSLGIIKTQWFEEIKLTVFLGMFLPKIFFTYEAMIFLMLEKPDCVQA